MWVIAVVIARKLVMAKVFVEVITLRLLLFHVSPFGLSS